MESSHEVVDGEHLQVKRDFDGLQDQVYCFSYLSDKRLKHLTYGRPIWLDLHVIAIPEL
jgi:hypothetical protein